jgi:ATP-binding cassette subfamily F protein uup
LEIKEDMRIIEFVKNIAENFPLADGSTLSASQFLTLFLFPPEQQYTYLSKLSGGEKKRLQLLAILFRNPNFLILDEPTNDLDLPTLSVLENFLSEYPGCLLIVSHDRYFMDRLVDHLFVFEGDGVVTDFPGNYSNYRIEERTKEKKGTAVTGTKKTEAEMPKPVVKAAPAPEKKKFSFKDKREYDQLEKELAALEAEKVTITEKMMDPSLNYDQIQQLSNRMVHITQQVEEKEMRWLELSEYIS